MSQTTRARDGSRDFDFHIGRWRIHNERLVQRLQGCTDWEVFGARQHAQLLPGGLGNRDDFVTDHWPGFVGMSLRLYSPLTRQWSIYWVSNRTGVLEPPVVGGFTGGVGVFEGRDQLDGRPIVVRSTWSDVTPSTARWQQDFSPDDGRRWETNWVMRLTRDESPAQSAAVVTDARRAVTPAGQDGARDFDFLLGRWRIRNERLVKRLQGCTEWETFEATADTSRLPGGLGNIGDFATDHWPGFVAIAPRFYDPHTRRWSIYWATNRTGRLEPPVVGGFTGGVGVFEGPDEQDGRPVVVRFTWSDITPTAARWEQAFSPDDGRTWETNWIMAFTREPEGGRA
jgi:hypothetical protein